jgi:hypothetical protein
MMFLLCQKVNIVNWSRQIRWSFHNTHLGTELLYFFFFYSSSLVTEATDINNAHATKAGDGSAQAADVGIISAHMTKVGDASATAANKSNLAAEVGGFHITSVDVARARRQHRTETGSMGAQTGSTSIQSGNDVLFHHKPYVPPEGQPGKNQGLQGKNHKIIKRKNGK